MNIRTPVLSILAFTFIVLLFVFAFTWIIFDFQGSSSSLKDTWSIVSSVFGGIATLVAAYIALFLYSDWRQAEKFNAAKEALISLTKLKSYIDNNYMRAKYHIDSYFLKNDQHPPNDYYIAERLISARKSKIEKEKYKSELNDLLNDFFEKADIYEVLFNDILIQYEDREFNFRSYMYYISNMYTQAYTADIQNMNITRTLSNKMKDEFERNYFNKIIIKLKKNIAI